MTIRRSSSGASLATLLELGAQIPRQPDALRRRVLARATAAAAVADFPLRAPLPVTRTSSSRQLARFAAAALAMGLAGTVYALSGSWSRPAPVPHALAPATAGTTAGDAAPSPVATASAMPVRPVAVETRAREKTAAAPGGDRSPRSRHDASGSETYSAELGLMRSAHNAYAAQEFANALVLVSEHARRFPRGLLAEEREALRVRCLLAAGRTAEAQRAAAEFPRRFPRSVLAPRIQAEAGAPRE